MWELEHKESWAPKNWYFWTVGLEKTLESPFNCKEIKPVHPKGNQSWIFIGRADPEAEAPILWSPNAKNWKRTWFWERLKAEGEEDDRGWDAWMASPARWTWVWVSSGNLWWAGRPGVLQSMASQRVRHDWATELNWTTFVITFLPKSKHLGKVACITQWSYEPCHAGPPWMNGSIVKSSDKTWSFIV